MPSGEVHWHEGMFLRQHHFLTEHRQMLRLMQLDEKWTLHHNWGLRSIGLNTDALANFRFSVTSLEARLRDGTLIEVPKDGPLSGARPQAGARGQPQRDGPPGGAGAEVESAQRQRRRPGRRDALLRHQPAARGREPGRQPPADPDPPAQPQAPALDREPGRVRDGADRPDREIGAGRGDPAARRDLLPPGPGLRRLARPGGRHPPGDLRPDRPKDREAGRTGRLARAQPRQHDARATR